MDKESTVIPTVITERTAEKLSEVLSHGLVGSIAYNGGELTGFSMKVSQGDCLLTIRAHFPAGHMVAWVGSPNPIDCLLKASRDIARNVLNWKVDKYRIG